jgi:hypothetical protein
MAKQTQKEVKKTSAKKKAPEAVQESKKVDTKKALSKIDKALKANDIMYGSEHIKLPLGGKSVAEIQKELKHVLNIPAEAQPRVNSKIVDGNYILQETDTLEFVKVSGQKG